MDLLERVLRGIRDGVDAMERMPTDLLRHVPGLCPSDKGGVTVLEARGIRVRLTLETRERAEAELARRRH